MAVRWITEADTSAPTDPVSARYVEAASWMLYKLTGEKYPGITERTEWYGFDQAACLPCAAFVPNMFVPVHGHVLFQTTTTNKLRLRGTPIQSVVSIREGGTELDSTDFWTIGKTYIQKRDNTPWLLDLGVEVTYRSGINPPEAGRQAAILLANQLIAAETDPDNCQLPQRVTSVSRQGLDFALLDPQDFLEQGRTGIYEIDAFIKAANPINARKKPRIFSVDIPSGETRV